MAEQAEPEAMSALRELEEPVAQEQGAPRAEQAAQAEPRKHPEAMGATVGMDLM